MIFFIFNNYLHWAAIYNPLVLLPLLSLILGFAWALASQCVFIRDLLMCVNNTQSILPESVFGYLFPNPFPFKIEQVCDELNDAVAAFFAWAGLFCFDLTRKDSADVLYARH